MKAVTKNKLTLVLLLAFIAAIAGSAYLQDENDGLRSKISRLQNKIEELENRIEKLQTIALSTNPGAGAEKGEGSSIAQASEGTPALTDDLPPGRRNLSPVRHPFPPVAQNGAFIGKSLYYSSLFPISGKPLGTLNNASVAAGSAGHGFEPEPRSEIALNAGHDSNGDKTSNRADDFFVGVGYFFLICYGYAKFAVEMISSHIFGRIFIYIFVIFLAQLVTNAILLRIWRHFSPKQRRLMKEQLFDLTAREHTKVVRIAPQPLTGNRQTRRLIRLSPDVQRVLSPGTRVSVP